MDDQEVTVMKGFMMAWRSGLALLALLGELSGSACLHAADGARQAVRPSSGARSLQFQELEDPIEPLTPRQPRTVSEENRLDALAWFGTGRIRQHRGDF